MQTDNSPGQEPDGEQLAGLYPANKIVAERSVYPATVEQVRVHRPNEEGYHDITLLGADGEIVGRNNRAPHRIRGALEGEYGYDIVVTAPR